MEGYFAWLSGDFAHGRLFLEVCVRNLPFACVFLFSAVEDGGAWGFDG